MTVTDSELKPGFSFVIPTYNSGVKIRRCLESIRSQDYPQDKVQLLIADGGSTDGTIDITREYGARIVANPDRLAEYGVKAGMKLVQRELAVVFADDNALVGRGWLSAVDEIFRQEHQAAAFWCRLVAAESDPPINHYFALIQSEPLSFMVNRYLGKYLASAAMKEADGVSYRVFEAIPGMPLVWGANGLTCRTAFIKPVWDTDRYLGDNDAFQIMIEQGHRIVCYSEDLLVFHHHVTSLFQWRDKWKRNFEKHFLANLQSRNLGWLYLPHFKAKVILWAVYSLIPVFSTTHAAFLAFRDRDWHWLYHPTASFLQAMTYLEILLLTTRGRAFIKDFFLGRASY